jgi:translation initiation factor 5
MSGGRLNIPSTIQDHAYRYTMPKMQLKQESRLNGVKTNITNLIDVANAIRVPELTIIKYFCAEVGSSHVSDSIITGSHKYEDLLKLLDKFIIKYAICSNCKYPEIAYDVQKKDVTAKCNACGSTRKLDTLHKAGKQLLKDIPTFYSANPEFRGKTGKAANELSKMQETQKDTRSKKKKGDANDVD